MTSKEKQQTSESGKAGGRDFLFSAYSGRPVKVSRSYDRFVIFMRWALSIVAFGLAVTVILWPNLQTNEVSFTLSTADVETSDDQIRMVNPRYEGRDNDGRPFVISAISGVQDSPDDPRIFLQGVDASFQLDPQTEVTATSASGTYMLEQEILELGGNVVIETTDGYQFTAQDAQFLLNEKVAVSDKALSGSGPVGQFSAEGFEVRVEERIAIFEGRVSMRLYPMGRI